MEDSQMAKRRKDVRDVIKKKNSTGSLLESDYNSEAFRATSARLLPRTMESICGFPLQKPGRMVGPIRKKK